MPQEVRRRASWGFRIKALALGGRARSISWENQGPERGRDLPIVTQHIRVTAIRARLPHLSKRGIAAFLPVGRVPGAETGESQGDVLRAPQHHGGRLCPLAPSPLPSSPCLEFRPRSAAPGAKHCPLLVSSSPSTAGWDQMPLHPLPKSQ